MTLVKDGSRMTTRGSTRWHLASLCAGLLLLFGTALGCGQVGRATETEGQVTFAESSSARSEDLVRSVELMESGEALTPESVSMSEKAADFSPPAQLPVYKITPVEAVTRESMDALATKLGFGQDRQYGEEGLSGASGSLTFPRADDATCFMLVDIGTVDSAFAAILAGQPPQPVSPEETRGIADAYLKSLGMEDELVFLGTYEATAYGTATPEGESERWVVEMGARYRAFVDGVPLVGPGAKIAVCVDPGGAVVEFCHFAQRATASKEKVAIGPVAAALVDLKAGKGEVPPDIDNERAKSISIESVDLCYYAPPAPSAYMYYKPVYVFHVRMADGTLGDWLLSAFDGSMLQEAI